MTDTPQAPAAPPESRIQLDEARLRIGDSVQMQLGDTPGAPRHYVKLIGFVKNRTVLVSMPPADSGASVQEGLRVVMRMFAGRFVYAFPSQVLRVLGKPYPYLHIEYPPDVVARTVRMADRVSLKIEGLAGDVAVTLENLSRGGAGLTSKEPLGEIGAEIRLRFTLALDGFERELDLPSVIRTAQSGAPDKLAHCGVQFTSIEPQDGLLLSGFVYQRLVTDSA